MEGTVGIWIAVVCFLLYLIPNLIAAGRKSKRTAGVFVVNFFLGWTLLGWVLALAWAAGSDKEETTGKSVEKISVPTISVADELTKLSQLHKDGVISTEEFEYQKTSILKKR